MSRVRIDAVGVLAPGLEGWDAARAVLAGTQTYVRTPVTPPAPEHLAVAERRRVSSNARWALAVVDAVLRDPAAAHHERLASVFASADGDGDVLAQMLAAMCTPPVQMSPTLFHNSVFNAPAGYASIAQRLTGPSTTLCAAEFTAAAALIEAYDQVLVDARTVLCVVVDTTYPQALAALRAPEPSFAAALLLRSNEGAVGHGHGSITLAVRDGATDAAQPPLCPPTDTGGTWGFSSTTASGLLPLLIAIARGRAARVPLAFAGGGDITVEYSP